MQQLDTVDRLTEENTDRLNIERPIRGLVGNDSEGSITSFDTET